MGRLKSALIGIGLWGMLAVNVIAAPTSFTLNFKGSGAKPVEGVTCGMNATADLDPYPPQQPGAAENRIYISPNELERNFVSGNIRDIRSNATITAAATEVWYYTVQVASSSGSTPVDISYRLTGQGFEGGEYKETILIEREGVEEPLFVDLANQTEQSLGSYTYDAEQGGDFTRYAFTVTYLRELNTSDIRVNVNGGDLFGETNPGVWRIAGSNDAYKASGEIVTANPTQSIEFKEVAGWNKPANVSISSNVNGIISRSYSEQRANLVFQYTPQELEGKGVTADVTGESLRGEPINTSIILTKTPDGSTFPTLNLPAGTNYTVTYSAIANDTTAIRYEVPTDPVNPVVIGDGVATVLAPNFPQRAGSVIVNQSAINFSEENGAASPQSVRVQVTLENRPTADVTLTVKFDQLSTFNTLTTGNHVTTSGQTPVIDNGAGTWTYTLTKDDWNTSDIILDFDVRGITGSIADNLNVTAASTDDDRYQDKNAIIPFNVVDLDVNRPQETSKIFEVSPKTTIVDDELPTEDYILGELNFGDVKTGEEVTQFILVKNLTAEAADFIVACSNDQVVIETRDGLTVPALGELAVAVTYTAGVTNLANTKVVFSSVEQFDGESSPSLKLIDTVQLVSNVYSDTEYALVSLKQPVVTVNPADAQNTTVDTEFAFEFDANPAIGSAANYSFTVTFPSSVDVSGLPEYSGTQTVTFTGTGATPPAAFTVPVDVTTTQLEAINLDAFTVDGVTNTYAFDGQLAITEAVQLATVDVNLDEQYTGRDVILIYRYLPFAQGGLGKVGNDIFPEGGPTFLDQVANAEELVIEIEKLIDSGLFDVNGDGASTGRDVILIYRYLPFAQGGLGKVGNDIFPEGAPTFLDNVADSDELVDNILQIMP